MDVVYDQRDHWLFQAKLAEQCHRWDDMLHSVGALARLNLHLLPDERRLIAVAYTTKMGQLRNAHRVLSARYEQERGTASAQAVASYLHTLVDEMWQVAIAASELVDTNLEAHDETVEGRAFYQKMSADLFRHVAEVRKQAEGMSYKEAARRARQRYLAAMKAVNDHCTGLEVTNPVKLAVLINFCVFLFEIEGNAGAALAVGRDVFEATFPKLDSLPEDDFETCRVQLQTLRDNIVYWAQVDMAVGATRPRQLGVRRR